MSVNQGVFKYEVRAVGKLIAYVSNYKLAKLIAGLYMIFAEADKVYIDEVYPWDEAEFNKPTHISLFNPKFSAK